MVDHLYVAETRPAGPSPWWLKGGAIFIGILGFGSLINALALGIGGFLLAGVVGELDPVEICEDDDSEDCVTIIEELIMLGQSNIWEIGAAASALLFLLSIPTAVVMWNAEDRDTGLKLAWAWIGIHAASQLYVTHVLVSWTNSFYDQMPSDGFDMGVVAMFNSIASYGGVLMCELTMAAGLALISYQTRPPTKVEVPSAFHDQDQ